MAILKIAEGEFLNTDIPAFEALSDLKITEQFIKLAQDLKKVAPRSEDFLYFTAIMLHGAEAALIDLKTGEPKVDKSGKVVTGGFTEDWKWECSDSSIDPYSNQNGDIFPSSELKKAYKKWVGRPLCINHQSSDVEGIRGIIIDTHWDDKCKRVVGLCALDKKSYPDLAHKVKTGYANCVSMGTAVGKALCTYCQKPAITEKDYCDHVRNKKGQRVNNVKIGEINLDLAPIELSLVVTPADQQAKVLKVIASLNNYIDQRNELLESKEVAASTQIKQIDEAVKVVEAQLNRLFAECSEDSCQFVRDDSGHIKMIKSAQQSVNWDSYFKIAEEADRAADPSLRKLLQGKMREMRPSLNIEEVKNDPRLLVAFSSAMRTNDPYLKQILADDMDKLEAKSESEPTPALTSPFGVEKDVNISGDSTVSIGANDERVGRMQNANPEDIMVGQEATPTNAFQFGNLQADKVLDTLMKQAQLIESEINKLKFNQVINSEEQMNESRLRRRAEARREMLKETGKTKKNKSKKAYFLGTEEPTPGKPKYKPDALADKARDADRHMMQDKDMGGEEGLFSGDEEMKKKLLRAEELQNRALKRRAYFHGTEEPMPGKSQYKKDQAAEKARVLDKNMMQDADMGGSEGLFPGDEEMKKKLSRAELSNAVLRTKFTKVRNTDSTINKSASYFEIFAGDKRLLKATAREIYGNQLNQYWDFISSQEYGKEVIAAIRNQGFQKVARLLKGAQAMPAGVPAAPPAPDMAAGMPQMPAMPPMGADMGMGAATGEAEEEPAKDADKSDKQSEVDGQLAKIEEAIAKIRDLVASDKGGKEIVDIDINVDDSGVEAKKGDDAADELGSSLTAALKPLAREIYAELDQAADELALISETFGKAASFNRKQKVVLAEVTSEALKEGSALLEEANVLIAVAKKAKEEEAEKAEKKSKVPAFMKAMKAKKVEKKNAKDKMNKADDKKKKMKAKKVKKAQLAEMLLKLAKDIEDDYMDDDMEEGSLFDSLDEEPKSRKHVDEEDDSEEELSFEDEEMLSDLEEGVSSEDDSLDDLDLERLLGKSDEEESEEEDVLETSEDDEDSLDELDEDLESEELDSDEDEEELDALDGSEFADDANDGGWCNECGQAKDGNHKKHKKHASSKEKDLVKMALESRRARREAMAKKATAGEFSPVLSDAHKGAENPETALDSKPASDGAVVEGLEEAHKKMVEVAKKSAAADPEATKYYKGFFGDAEGGNEYAAELTKDFVTKKAEDEKSKYRVKLRRAYDLGLEMQEKGLLSRTKEALDSQVDEIMKFSDDAFEAFKRSVANTRAVVKTAAAKPVLQSGVREDNSEPSESLSISDALVNISWS